MQGVKPAGQTEFSGFCLFYRVQSGSGFHNKLSNNPEMYIVSNNRRRMCNYCLGISICHKSAPSTTCSNLCAFKSDRPPPPPPHTHPQTHTHTHTYTRAHSPCLHPTHSLCNTSTIKCNFKLSAVFYRAWYSPLHSLFSAE